MKQKIISSSFFLVAFFFALPLVDATVNTEDLNPIHVGSLSDGENGAKLSGASDVFVSGDYAYVTARTSDTLEIIDVSDPLFPVPVGSLSHGDGGAELDGAWSVFVRDGYAFVTSKNSDALEIIDVSDPENPTHVSALLDGDGGAMLNAPIDIDISGDYAYIASYSSDALEIVDISNPLEPWHVSSLRDGVFGVLLDGASDILVENNFAYVTSQWSNSLEIIDISDPKNPQHSGSISHPIFLRQARSVAIHGTYAFVTARSKLALQVIDISDKTNPTFAGNLGEGSDGAKLNDPNAIVIEGELAYISSYRSNAIEMVDVSDPQKPKHIAHLTHGVGGVNLKYPNAIFVSGGFVYVTSSYSPGVLEIIKPTPAPDIVVSSFDYDFGSTESGTVLTNTFVITNTGYLDLIIGDFVPVNDVDFEIQNNTCKNSSLDIRETCTFDVNFIAEGEGLKTGVIGILNNIEEKNPIIVQIQGTVTQAEEEGNKADVCHLPDSENPTTLNISINAISAHLSHGDAEGSCPLTLPVDINDDNSFLSNETINMTIRPLGVSITYGSGGPNVPVKLQTKIGNQTHTIFHGTEPQVLGSNPLIINNIPQGTTVHFLGTSYNPYWPDWVLYSQETEEDSSLIIALKNGDAVPDFTPYQQQPSIETFLEGYIDENGIVTIGEQEIIYLFELGTSNPTSSSADFQDGVFLVSFE